MSLVIYCFNFPNGKKYIGKTQKGLEVRMRSHRHHARHGNTYLYKAIRKYGWDQISLDILAEPDTIELLNETEKKLIMEHDTTNPDKGYNLREGGEGGAHSEETRQKISRANSGKNNGMYGKTSVWKTRKFSEEHRRKLSESHKGQKAWNKGLKTGPTGPKSDETKRKISKANSGANNGQAKMTWETVDKIREDYATGEYTQKALAEKHEVSKYMVHMVVTNKAWKRE
jgi:hypothetical protein